MSFQQGLSGLNASSKNLEVISNNIANANTFGAKTSRAEFSSVYATALNGSGTNQVGIGTALQAVAQQFTQGNVSTTENPMDLAINGPGFFQISDGNSPVTFTRNGQFKVDRDGYIVNNSQERLLGYSADGNGVIQPGQLSPLRLPTDGINPNPSSRVAVEMNLDSRLAVTLPAAAPMIDFANAGSYNNATSLTLYDAKGQDVAMSFYFQKAANDQWNVYATANGSTVSDFHPDEKEHQCSIHATVLSCEWLGREINMIDCPGSPDFVSEPLSALRVADFALVVRGVVPRRPGDLNCDERVDFDDINPFVLALTDRPAYEAV